MIWPPPIGQAPVALPPPWPAPRPPAVPLPAPEPPSADPQPRPAVEPHAGIPGVVGSPWQWDTTPTRPARLVAWAESEAPYRSASRRPLVLLSAALGVALVGSAVVFL